MQVSILSLVLSLFLVIPVLSRIIPQTPLHCATVSVADYGYKGPGFYRIVSYQTPSLAASLNDTSADTAIVAKSPADNDNSQVWQFAEVGPAQVLIINNGTGALLTSIKNRGPTGATAIPPYDLRGRWTLDTVSYGGIQGAPVVLGVSAPSSLVFDLYEEKTVVGTPIIVYPLKTGPTRGKNQAWYLQYLG